MGQVKRGCLLRLGQSGEAKSEASKGLLAQASQASTEASRGSKCLLGQASQASTEATEVTRSQSDDFLVQPPPGGGRQDFTASPFCCVTALLR